MATKQPLKGIKGKQYDIINNFNRGYNTTTADGVLDDNIFRTLVNFEVKEEGIIKKRKGIKDTGLGNLIKLFYDLKADPTDFTETLNEGVTFTTPLTGTLNGSTNNNLNAHNEFFKMLKDTINYTDAESTTTAIDVIYDNVAYLTINNRQMLDDYAEYGDSMLSWDISSTLEFTAIITGYYMFKEHANSYLAPLEKNVFKTIHCKMILDNATSLQVSPHISLSLDVDIDKTTVIHVTPATNKINKLSKVLYDEKYLRVLDYNGSKYFTTGYEIYKLVDGILTPFSAATAYKPTAIEVTFIGFNILAASPLEWIDNGTGNANAVKGLFLTLNGEPTQKIPTVYTTTADKPFKINVITTGTGTLEKPKFRKDNGDIDETTNPYIEMTGTYGVGALANVFTCTEFNLEGKFELKVVKGDGVPYIGYFTAEAQQEKVVGKISTIDDLVHSSLRCNIINNQLVLYGGHGYVFFSEFDNFLYFPNYNYLYAIDNTNEDVISIKYFRQFHAVALNTKFKRLSGSFPFPRESDGLYPLNDFVGCVNANTIKQVENNLVFLSNLGLYVLKQGYTGEGTENIVPIDGAILDDYTRENAINAVVKGNNYVLSMGSEVLLFNFVRGAYYKYLFNMTEATGYTSKLSGLFERDLYSNQLYVCKIINKTADDTKELKVMDFEAEGWYSDDTNPYSTYFILPKINGGTPTNNKKWKSIRLKGSNDGDSLVPLYIVVRVDDVKVLDPEKYYIRIDEDTNYIYYEEIINSNEELTFRRGAVLGEMILGETMLGDIKTQVIKCPLTEARGKSISIELYDIYPGADGPVGTNIEPFTITDIGLEYKLKKVKED